MNTRRTRSQPNNLFDDLGSGFNDFDTSPTSHVPTAVSNDDLSFFNSNFELDMPRGGGGGSTGFDQPSSFQPANDSFGSPPSSAASNMMGNLFNNTGYSGPSAASFFGNNLAADFMLGMGMDQMNKTAITTASRYWAFFENLKVYFNVNNSYVLSKILLILFPFRRKWTSSNNPPAMNIPGSQNENEPRDLNHPDLYIPSMFFITYILLVCALLGTKSKFTPEYLTSLASTGSLILLLEIILVKLGFYLLAVPSSIGLLDITAYSGYKFVGVVLSVLASALVGYWAYLPVCILTSLTMSLFMIKTLRRACVNQNDMRLQMDQMGRQRSTFIIIVALLQVPIFLLLTYRYARDEYSILNWLLTASTNSGRQTMTQIASKVVPAVVEQVVTGDTPISDLIAA
jgi:hypothetical protein